MTKKKVIVIGLDGMDPSIIECLMSDGELPHFAELRDMGFYSRLKTTYPALTPVAWSSFVTGVNPGGHGIFDFIRRDPQTYRAEFALNRFEPPKNMFVGPKVVNRRRGIPIWTTLTEAGIPSVVLRCPCTFPPDQIAGKMLAGVGVPDLRGSQGTGTFYTQDRSVKAKESEHIVYLEPGSSLNTHVIGPRNTATNATGDVLVPINAIVNTQARTVSIATDADPPKVEVREGAWSPWIRMKFKLSLLQSMSGLVRFYVRQVAPHVEMYASPVNFDPKLPVFPISWPAGYAKELAERIGMFGTLGMAEDHAGLNNGRFDEHAYLAQCRSVMLEREKMTFFELDRLEEGLFFVVFDTPDRVQHMFWRFRDPKHPLHDPRRAAEFGRCIEDHYSWYDSLLGRILERVGDDAMLLVLSDHGFTGFRRAIHVNHWLAENRFLAYRNNEVDWSNTTAYAVGMSGIYLNKKGREANGIVQEGVNAEFVRKAISKGLAGLMDSATGETAVSSVLAREEIYSGPFLEESPDLILNCAPGYRVSWQTAIGGSASQMFEDNTQCWSGDHIVDPEAVPGILFLNRRIKLDDAKISNLVPMILNHLGVVPEIGN